MSEVSAPPFALVVEDELLLRTVLAHALAAAGFDVAEAADADQALELLKLREDTLAVLITDVQMPGALDGCGLAWRVHELCPTAEILVVSGVFKPEPGELPATARFLPKPVVPERVALELMGTLQERQCGRA
jgi:CheY-like chemotaxis protein